MSKEAKNATSSTPKKKNSKKGESSSDVSAKFQGDGLSFKAKLYGSVDVKEARGDVMCQQAMQSLKSEMKKGANHHKQKIIIKININGTVLVDAASNKTLASHKVNRISFISKDSSDSRSFSYVVGDDDGKHVLYGIKTDKPAEAVLLTFRDLFQAVVQQQKESAQDKCSQSSSAGEEAGCRTSATSDNAKPFPLNIPINDEPFVADVEDLSPTDNLMACPVEVRDSNPFETSAGDEPEEVAPSNEASAVNKELQSDLLGTSNTSVTNEETTAETQSTLLQMAGADGGKSSITPVTTAEHADEYLGSSAEDQTNMQIETKSTVVVSQGTSDASCWSEICTTENQVTSSTTAAVMEQDSTRPTDKDQVSNSGQDISLNSSPFSDNPLSPNDIKEADNLRPAACDAELKPNLFPNKTETTVVDNTLPEPSGASVTIAADATNPWGTSSDSNLNSSNPWATFDDSGTTVGVGTSTDPWADTPFKLANDQMSTAESPSTAVANSAASDPFAFSSGAISFDTDPFKDVDPFNTDPFTDVKADPFLSSDPFDTPDLFGSDVSATVDEKPTAEGNVHLSMGNGHVGDKMKLEECNVSQNTPKRNSEPSPSPPLSSLDSCSSKSDSSSVISDSERKEDNDSASFDSERKEDSDSASFAPPKGPAPTLPPDILVSNEKRGPPPAIPARRPVPPVPVRKLEVRTSGIATAESVVTPTAESDATELPLSPVPSFPPPQLPHGATIAAPPKIPARPNKSPGSDPAS